MSIKTRISLKALQLTLTYLVPQPVFFSSVPLSNPRIQFSQYIIRLGK